MSRAAVAVVGGGIAGLTAARALTSDCEVTLFESSEQLGGKIQTRQLEGHPVDLGPDSFITRNPAATQLCNELGISAELIEPAANSVAIFSRGLLQSLPAAIVLGVPTGLGSLWSSKVVSVAAVVYAAGDLLWRRRVVLPGALERARSGVADPSVEEVFGPRLGRAVLRTLIDPLLGGINASDVSVLSLAAAAPQLLARIEGQRSVMRALRAEPATFVRADSAPLLGLAGGMTTLPRALTNALEHSGALLRTASAVTSLSLTPDGRWLVQTARDKLLCDAVVLATPAFVSGPLLHPLDAELAGELGEIPYSGLVAACFSWPAAAVPAATTRRLQEVLPPQPGGMPAGNPLPGSGVLVPRDGRRLLSAMAFTSSKWPQSSAPSNVVIRAFAGRHRDERALELSETAVREALLQDVHEVLGIDAPPAAAVVQRYERALPQYVTGHLGRIARIESHLERHPTLALAGAAYRGIGIPACVESGTAASERVRRALGLPSSPAEASEPPIS